MTKFILAALLALSASAAAAQTTAGPNTYVANSGTPIVDTGPRYCPELAGTEHPFRIICPSWPDTATAVTGATIAVDAHRPDGQVGGATDMGAASDPTEPSAQED